MATCNKQYNEQKLYFDVIVGKHHKMQDWEQFTSHLEFE